MNLCILTGNLGNDPEIFYSSDGDPIASFNLAFKSGKDKTSWIKVTAFKKTWGMKSGPPLKFTCIIWGVMNGRQWISLNLQGKKVSHTFTHGRGDKLKDYLIKIK